MATNSSGGQQSSPPQPSIHPHPHPHPNHHQRTFTNSSTSSTGRAFNPHHRSSEVFSTGLLPLRVPSAVDINTHQGSSSDGTASVGSLHLDITNVCPKTIEEAIRQMQQVPSVDFACSGLNSSSSGGRNQIKSNPQYHQAKYFYHNHPLEVEEEIEEEEEKYSRFSPQTANYTDRTFQQYSSNSSSNHFYPHHPVVQQPTYTVTDSYGLRAAEAISSPSSSSPRFISPPSPAKTSSSSLSKPFSKAAAEHHPQPSTSRWLEPPPSSSAGGANFHRKYSVMNSSSNNNNSTLPFTGSDKPSTSSSLANHSYSYGQAQQQPSTIMSRSTPGNASFRSNLSASSGLLHPKGGSSVNTTKASNTSSTNSHHHQRRLTVARLGSDFSTNSSGLPFSSAGADSEASDYFVPRESWLTSLYVKMPKSKSFVRLQLELLNLPFFASVGRFLEDTCSVGARSSSKGRHHHHSGNENCRTAEEEKTLLEKNSFLFALFNQYVPHNRIPLESLSKYVRRLQKYEILATIEFSFLKTPSINVQQQQQQQQTNRRTTSGDRSPITTTTNGPNGIIPSTSASVGKRQYAIPSQSACSMRQAYRRENLPKNTNQRYVPFDYNRVVLRGGENQRKGTGTQASSDYINASHVDSLLKPNAYIVAQGPNEVTVGDFWRMLWQQNVHVVVMLTKVYEFIRVMCTQYWPSALHKPELYDEGTFEVTLVDEDRLADYVVRTMKVRNLREFPKTREEEEREKEEKEANQASTSKTTSSSAAKHSEKSSPKYRTIYQLHFLSWNVNSCPYSDSILKFRRRVQIYEKQCQAEAAVAAATASTSSSSGTSGSPGPLVVHCSTGCGRSGTYVCLDANLALAEEEGVLDIFNYARALRRARVSMIEQLEQYRFIYETIEESVVCGKTWFHVSEISAQMKAKSAKRVAGGAGNGNGNGKRGGRRRGNNSNNSNVGKNEYQVEFEKLLRMTSSFSIGDCAGGHRLENRYKNRDVSIVPPDNFRPYLTSYQSKDNTDYINAVFVDGYSRPREYIVTEWPLRSTIADIWSLIYDHDCNTVVVLGGVPPNASKSAFPPFWPKDQLSSPSKSSSSSSIPPTKYGPIWTVETISTNHPPNISSWVLRVHKKVMSLTELMAGIKAEPKITQVFEFGAWPADYKVPTSTNALVELIHMVERWRQRTSYGPVLVVSANGKSRVGVYCAANFAIEQVVAHEEIDIFNAVKTVRRHRSALIETIMEYKYCYDLCLHYYSHYMSKGNYNQIFRKNL